MTSILGQTNKPTMAGGGAGGQARAGEFAMTDTHFIDSFWWGSGAGEYW